MASASCRRSIASCVRYHSVVVARVRMTAKQTEYERGLDKVQQQQYRYVVVPCMHDTISCMVGRKNSIIINIILVLLIVHNYCSSSTSGITITITSNYIVELSILCII